MRIALVLALAACQPEEAAPRPRPTPVTPKDAAPAIDAAPAPYTGVITAAELVEIGPRVAGLIKAVNVNVGDKVAAGDVVVEMDPITLKEELRAAEAALAAASAASRQAAVDVEDARRKLALETKAVAAGVSPTQNIEEAKLGVKRAQAALERARSAQAAEAARTQTARDHVDNASLRAPFAGTVANRYHDAGNRVPAGGSILRIVGHGNVRLRFAVPPQLAETVKIGTKISATVDTVAKPIAAVVKSVSPTIDPASGLIIVEAELDGPVETELRPGLAAVVAPP